MLYSVHFDKCTFSLLNFRILSLYSVNVRYSLHVNIILNAFQAGICLQLMKMCLWFSSFCTLHYRANIPKIKQNLLKEFFLKNSAKVINISLAWCCLINPSFLMPQAWQFDKIIILPLFVSTTLGILFFVFFLHFQQ